MSAAGYAEGLLLLTFRSDPFRHPVRGNASASNSVRGVVLLNRSLTTAYWLGITFEGFVTTASGARSPFGSQVLAYLSEEAEPTLELSEVPELAQALTSFLGMTAPGLSATDLEAPEWAGDVWLAGSNTGLLMAATAERRLNPFFLALAAGIYTADSVWTTARNAGDLFERIVVNKESLTPEQVFDQMLSSEHSFIEGSIGQLQQVAKPWVEEYFGSQAASVTGEVIAWGIRLPGYALSFKKGGAGAYKVIRSLPASARHAAQTVKKGWDFYDRSVQTINIARAVSPPGKVNLADLDKKGGRTGLKVAGAAGALAVAGVAVGNAASPKSAAPTAPSPSSARCNQETRSGGFGVTTTVHDLGKTSGTFLFTWNNLNIPDRIVIVYEGRQLLDTGFVPGTGSRSLSFSGRSRTITVTVTGDVSNTQWTYVVGCP